MINFRSYTDLNETIKKNISKLPQDIDLVVGIPRSGLLAANIIALLMNKPLVDLEGLLEKKTFSSGLRLARSDSGFSKIKKILVIDDSLNSGAALKKAQIKIKQSDIKKEIIYGVIYLKPGQENKVDLYFEHCSLPRVFEWNIFHHDIISRSCVDIDGVLCRDPTEKENDDGKKYFHFIRSVTPKIVPTIEISHLVTCRLEKYRKDTEYWLKKNNIKYRNLIMMPYKTKEERLLSRSHGEYKAEKYLESKCDLFIESDFNQASEIFDLTRKDVFSFENSIMLSTDNSVPTNAQNYHKISLVPNRQCTNDAYNKQVIFKESINKRSKLITFFSHSSQLAGAERSMVELINELKEENIFSHVVLPNEGPLQNELEKNHIPYDIVSLNWWANQKQKSEEEINNDWTNSINNLINFLPKLSKINPSLIYTNTIVSPWGSIAAEYLNLPHIWHIREYGDFLKFYFKYDETIKYIEKNSDLIITNSKSVSDHISRFLKEKKPIVVYNYIDIPNNLLKEKIKSPFIDQDSLKIIVCGSVYEGKNQLEAIKAVYKLNKTNLNTELLILGPLADKKYFKAISQFVIDNKLSDKVHFNNFVKNPYPYILTSDIVLVPSKSEAFGRTAIEGMLLSRPIIVSSNCGITEIIQNGKNGFTYKLGDINNLVEVISKLNNKKLRNKISKYAYVHIKEINNKKNYGGKIYNIIKKMIAKPKLNKKTSSIDSLTINSLITLNNNIKVSLNKLELENKINEVNHQAYQLEHDLNKIRSAKAFKLWRLYCKISGK